MELMAVPKKKVHRTLTPCRHKKGLRNGPKARKTVPAIVHCKCIRYKFQFLHVIKVLAACQMTPMCPGGTYLYPKLHGNG
ncbi:unnamed protein product, partial [Musa banksii]